MIKRIALLFSLLVLIFTSVHAQNADKIPACQNPKFHKEVDNYLKYSVPAIGVDELANIQSEVYIFDTRELKEYQVSHIEGASYLGYDDFNVSRLGDLPKDTPIVVYCSIGYRSEKIGEKLQDLGYTNVLNLYGSIFEWVNRGNDLVNGMGLKTTEVHTYNKKWSKWVDEDKATKIW